MAVDQRSPRSEVIRQALPPSSRQVELSAFGEATFHVKHLEYLLRYSAKNPRFMESWRNSRNCRLALTRTVDSQRLGTGMWPP